MTYIVTILMNNQITWIFFTKMFVDSWFVHILIKKFSRFDVIFNWQHCK